MNKRNLISILMLITLLLSSVPNSIAIEYDTNWRWYVENETYQLLITMDFDELRYTDTYIIFNNTGFNITAPDNILIIIRDLDDDIINAVAGETVVLFSAYMDSGLTDLVISGNKPNTLYNITRVGTLVDQELSDSGGNITISIVGGIAYIYRVVVAGGFNTAPVLHAEYPHDGQTDIPITGIPVNIYAEDDATDMRTDIWWNNNGEWSQVAGWDVWQLDISNFSRIFLDDFNDDGQVDFQDYGLWNLADGWENNGLRIFGYVDGDYDNHSITDDWGLTDVGTTYYWSVNCTDGTLWTNETYSFTTVANIAPTITSPSPSDGASGVSISTSTLSVSIADNEDTFNWTITTSPNIGTASGNDETDGTKTCTVSGLTYDAFYTWTVSVTDGTVWTNTTYDFTVESDPGGGPGPPNEAPTITNPYPTDESYLITPEPICYVTVADGDFDNIDVNFYWQNESDVFINMQNNDSVSSGEVVYWNYTNASSYDTTYTWKVTADDGTINISKTFSFTVRPNEPQLNWTIPINGAIDVSADGSVINANMFDYQDDLINVTIWSNFTGSWVKYAGYGLDIYATWFINDNNNDGQYLEFVSFQTAEGWQGNGNRGFYDPNTPYNYLVTDDWGMTEYNTKYWLSFNISDDSRAWNNQTISFTTEINTAPVITDPIPRDGVRWISIHTTNLSIMITDANSDFNYTIETDPNVGSISANNVGDGVKGVTVSNLNYSTTYYWYVNATDGETWTNKTYSFTTKGSSDFDFGDINIEGFPEWAVGPFKVYVDDFIWVFIFIGLVGIVWSSTKNVGSTLISILIVFAAFGTKKGFVDGLGQQVSLFFSVVAAICLAVLILGLYLQKRRG